MLIASAGVAVMSDAVVRQLVRRLNERPVSHVGKTCVGKSDRPKTLLIFHVLVTLRLLPNKRFRACYTSSGRKSIIRTKMYETSLSKPQLCLWLFLGTLIIEERNDRHNGRALHRGRSAPFATKLHGECSLPDRALCNRHLAGTVSTRN